MNEKDEKSAAIAMFERCSQAKPITSPDEALDTIERVYLTPLAAIVRAEVERLRSDLAAARADAERWQRIVTEIADDDGCSCSTARLIDAALAGEKNNG